uniref:Uncharacterized protein n=1 Tax=Cucumis melo TaxID=3656 RepID=A0A9I9EGS7_CUCME
MKYNKGPNIQRAILLTFKNSTISHTPRIPQSPSISPLDNLQDHSEPTWTWGFVPIAPKGCFSNLLPSLSS